MSGVEVQRLAAEVSGAAAQQQAVAVPDGVAQQPAVVVVPDGVAEPLMVADREASRPAADLSAVPWVFRRAQALPSPVRQRVERSAHALRMSQAASPSERSWQAARGEDLS